jgi:predicted RNA-binding protein with PUA-like domain
MSKNYWLVKQEPETFSWDEFVAAGQTDWTGVRNFQARNNLKAMKTGDRAIYYHSGKEKAAVGIAEVVKAAYPDPTAKDGDWVAVDIKPVSRFARSVPLAEMRADSELSELTLLRQTQLSVMPVSKQEFDRLVKLGKATAK